ncbi:hypothetical protein OROGR_004741 [Orobanche gracilis]
MKSYGVPEQFGSTDCGFFIMRYMKDIVEDKNLDLLQSGDIWQPLPMRTPQSISMKSE